MKSKVRRFGNSKGVTIPPIYLEELELEINSDIEMTREGDKLIIKKYVENSNNNTPDR